MELSTYQKESKKTDQFSDEPEKVMHHLLNLTESVGILNRVVEQEFRNKELPGEYARSRLSRKLGDILWYVANIATRYEINLDDMAAQNLTLTKERWGKNNRLRGKALDDEFPKFEQLPRQLDIIFFDPMPTDKLRRILLCVPMGKGEWIQIGDRVDDNSTGDDGYRFHDIFHLANVGFLGWSPVIRALLKRKRKSREHIDRIEDGARAANVEEAIAAFVFSHAKEVEFFAGQRSVDFNILKTIERITQGLEVANRPYDDWENAILHGYRIFREIKAQGGEGLVSVRLLDKDVSKRITLSEIPPEVRQILCADEDQRQVDNARRRRADT